MNDNLIRFDPGHNYYDDLLRSSSSKCKYFTVHEYNLLAEELNELLIMTYNIRSFNKHIDDFHSIMHNFESYPHILVLSETWLTENIDCTLPGYTTYHTIRVGKRSGGVSVLV